jgi:phytoene dehydrogenase-like protein
MASLPWRYGQTTDTSADEWLGATQATWAHFGITGGHIHHVDNTVSFTDRMPYATGVPGLYAGSAGCHPAGSVIGAAGHNAARRILRDLDHPVVRSAAGPAR